MAADEAWLPVDSVRSNTSRREDLDARVVALYSAHRDGIYRFLVSVALKPQGDRGDHWILLILPGFL